MKDILTLGERIKLYNTLATAWNQLHDHRDRIIEAKSEKHSQSYHLIIDRFDGFHLRMMEEAKTQFEELKKAGVVTRHQIKMIRNMDFPDSRLPILSESIWDTE